MAVTTAAMEKLREQGWHLSEDGYNLVSDSGSISDIQKIIKKALDCDLKEISCGQGDFSRDNVVLQIQKLRNVAAPKSNEESRSAPRMLKLSLTDGQNNFQAVEIEQISSLSLNTPPGTKLLIKKGILPISHGIILLKSSHIANILGGKVGSLMEKWELHKKLALHTRVRSAEEGGPPPWIPFGKKIVKISDQDKNFKALADKERTTKENAEFEAQRKDAIAEAAKQGSKKVFGGGNKRLLDYSVQRIVDQGFSIEQAEYSLRLNRNNVDRAVKHLQRTENRNNRDPGNSRDLREPRGKRFEKKAEDGKPSNGRVSLFDFLEDKLPAQSDLMEENTIQLMSDPRDKARGNFDRFESKVTDPPVRGGRSQRGGRAYQPPPRHSEEAKSNKWTNNANYSTPQQMQHNTGSNSQQGKPPRFQKNQENTNYNQQNNDYKGAAYNRTPHYSDNRNSYVPPRLEGGAGNANANGSRNSYNRNPNSIRNYHQSPGIVEPNSRHKYEHDASYSKYNDRAQPDTIHRSDTMLTYQSNPNGNDKNDKNRPTRNSSNLMDNRNDGKGAFGHNRHKGPSPLDNNSMDDQTSGSWVWQKGAKCMAKYWEDNRYYNAEVTAVSKKTCVVRFLDFHNFEEVLQADCLPITVEDREAFQGFDRESPRQDRPVDNKQHYNQPHNHINIGMEFRRGGGGTGSRGYNRRRGQQQRGAQPIYQPPAQRNYTAPNIAPTPVPSTRNYPTP